MNTPSTNLTILHDTQEWSTDIEGEIKEIKVDGKRLSDIHELAIKVEGVAQSIRTLILCLGAIVMICLVCNIGMATWVATNDDDITEAVFSVNSENRDKIIKLENQASEYAKKITELGWVWKNGKWQQFGNSHVNPSK